MKMKMHLVKSLEKLTQKKRKHHTRLKREIHKKYGISYRTLFYMKEYGPHRNVAKNIVKESVKILLLTSIISSLGGFALESIKPIFVSIFPLVIMLPVINGIIGNYGTIISSRFTSMLYRGELTQKKYRHRRLAKLMAQILIIATVMATAGAFISLFISSLMGNPVDRVFAYKIAYIIVFDVLILITIIFFVAIIAGMRIYKKNEDPDNFLIPITTAIADFGNMIILAALIILFF